MVLDARPSGVVQVAVEVVGGMLDGEAMIAPKAERMSKHRMHQGSHSSYDRKRAGTA